MESTSMNPEKCNVCNASFSSKNGLLHHIYQKHDKRPFPCEFCTLSFKSQIEVDMHQHVHTIERPNKCRLCDRAYKFEEDLEIHMNIHVGYTFKCDKCGKGFQSARALQSHKGLTCYNKKLHQSLQPDLKKNTSDHKKKSKIHVKQVDEEFRCVYCDQTFELRSQMDKHLRFHLKALKVSPAQQSLELKLDNTTKGKKIFGLLSCPRCDRNFLNKAGLSKHLLMHKSHDEQKRYFGNKTFDLKPFKCPHCKESFKYLGTLTRHKRSHKDEKPLNFSQNDHSLQFPSTHKLFSCDECHEEFTSASEMGKHRLYHHPSNSEGMTRQDDIVKESDLDIENENVDQIENKHSNDEQVEIDHGNEDGDQVDFNHNKDDSYFPVDIHYRDQDGDDSDDQIDIDHIDDQIDIEHVDDQIDIEHVDDQIDEHVNDQIDEHVDDQIDEQEDIDEIDDRVDLDEVDNYQTDDEININQTDDQVDIEHIDGDDSVDEVEIVHIDDDSDDHDDKKQFTENRNVSLEEQDKNRYTAYNEFQTFHIDYVEATCTNNNSSFIKTEDHIKVENNKHKPQTLYAASYNQVQCKLEEYKDEEVQIIDICHSDNETQNFDKKLQPEACLKLLKSEIPLEVELIDLKSEIILSNLTETSALTLKEPKSKGIDLLVQNIPFSVDLSKVKVDEVLDV